MSHHSHDPRSTLNLLPAEAHIFITQDGSPTLQWRRADGYEEKMHHSGGALSESLYIYHQALVMALDHGAPARVLSVGLGLGYNELIAIGEFVKRDCLMQARVWSFETNDVLRTEFAAWVQGHAMASAPLPTLYEQIVEGVANGVGVTASVLRTAAQHLLLNGQLQLRGPFPQEAGDITDAGCVFYDAYSKKMNPELWDEEKMVRSLEPHLSSTTVLTTYAATGGLRRALKTLGFGPIPRPGFQGKRESTLAIRIHRG